MPCMSMQGNIFLIGPMGVGKSTIGRKLAALTSKQFIDADQELEARTGVSISVIFDIEGEDGFRRREAALLNELTEKDDIILATGGGAILSEANRQVLRARGYVVYLHADIDTLVKRTHRDRSRPLLQNVDRKKKLQDLMEVREPIYRQEADLVIDTNNESPTTVARKIVEKMHQTPVSSS